jgi:4-amino-4-deoxy-L-arabinose transferase-like glycosyltransferase
MKRIPNDAALRRVLGEAATLIGFFRVSRRAGILLLASMILMIAWSLVVPIFEAPDEPAHWRYARYIHQTHQLPHYSAADPEAHSPPLYYLLVAPFASHSQIPPRLTWRDSNGTINLPSPPRITQNSVSDFSKYWPIRITRLISILISLTTVLFCYKVGVEVTDRESTGLLAGALVAFLPQFTFRSMNVSNDALVAALGSVVVYTIVRMVERGVGAKIAIAAALAMAGAFLAKASAIFFPGSFALAVLTDKISWDRKLKLLSAIGISVLLVAPWLIRNEILYGDIFVRKAILKAVPFLVRQKSITSSYFLDPFPRILALSFVGVFGRMNVLMPQWIYQAFAVLGGFALTGYLVGLTRREIDQRLTIILLSMVLLNLLVVIDFNLMFDQPQGRYMFPSLAAISILVALGLENLPYWSRTMRRVLVTAFFLINIYVLLTVALPTYWPPLPMANSTTITRLIPTSLSELYRANEGNYLQVTGDDPEVVVDIDLPASLYNFLVFKIQGEPTHGSVSGSVYLKMNDTNPIPDKRILFTWTLDRNPTKVIIPLYLYPEWRGRLVELRLKFFDLPDRTYKGPSLQVSEIQLAGSFSDTTGP